MSWRWESLDSSGQPVEGAPTGTFPTQGEAEAWLSESWKDLADAGVAAVTLYEEGVVAYGPMPLDPA